MTDDIENNDVENLSLEDAVTAVTDQNVEFTTEDVEKKYTILPILTYPDKRLNEESVEVNEEEIGTEELNTQIINMLGTMRVHKGIGLAAPQVGIFKRMCVFNWVDDKYFVMINPMVLSQTEETFELEEGCLSVPGYFDKRERPAKIVVGYQDMEGNRKETEFTGIYAFSVLHEIDHLDGKVFVDGLSKLKQMRVRSKVKKTIRNSDNYNS